MVQKLKLRILIHNLSKVLLVSLVFACLLRCVPVNTSTSTANFVPKKISYTDRNYDPSVGTVLIYNQDPISPPVVRLNSREEVTVSFDHFSDESIYIFAKIIHCDASWNKSNLTDLQYLDQFNELPFNNYQFSQNTLTPYVHYEMNLPMPKISGNYLLVVYRDSNLSDLLFTRRFLVTENIVPIQASINIPIQVDMRDSGQDLEINVGYEGLLTSVPEREIFLTVRQNYRWDNAKTNLKAFNNQIGNSKLEFRSMTKELTFFGGNEFRMIDLRSNSLAGFNIAKVERANRITAQSMALQPYRGTVYVTPLQNDRNGLFFLGSVDPGMAELDQDYVYTTLNFDLGNQINEPLYVVGQFNNWAKDINSKLIYNADRQLYQTRHLLKQGIYFFTVEGKSADGPYPFDQSFRLTENDYDIIVYQRSINTNYDRIIGYYRFNSGRN